MRNNSLTPLLPTSLSVSVAQPTPLLEVQGYATEEDPIQGLRDMHDYRWHCNILKGILIQSAGKYHAKRLAELATTESTL